MTRLFSGRLTRKRQGNARGDRFPPLVRASEMFHTRNGTHQQLAMKILFEREGCFLVLGGKCFGKSTPVNPQGLLYWWYSD